MDKVSLTVDNLNTHGFQAREFDTAEQAKEAALALIGGGSVGFGGSVTVRDMGIYDALEANGNKLYWHWKAKSPDEMPGIFKAADGADFYICSSNAILEEGALLNIDGTGNRVANMFYGPKTVIVIAGENKLASGFDEARARIKSDACPPNAKRLNLPTPCAVDSCNDCNSPKRMCRVTVLMERPSNNVPNVHVFIVRQKLGY